MILFYKIQYYINYFINYYYYFCKTRNPFESKLGDTVHESNFVEFVPQKFEVSPIQSAHESSTVQLGVGHKVYPLIIRNQGSVFHARVAVG